MNLEEYEEIPRWITVTFRRKALCSNNMKDSSYETGRKRGSLVEMENWNRLPLMDDAATLRKCHGRRSDLYSDWYFLPVWDGDLLAHSAKPIPDWPMRMMQQVDAFVKKNTKERFGPVRTVKPELVIWKCFSKGSKTKSTS